MTAVRRVLLVHNAYREPGGEDAVLRDEAALLQRHGVEVQIYRRDNHEIDERGAVGAAMDAIWSRRTTSEIDALIADFAPEVVHAHNTFALVSPSLYWAAQRARVPVVQTLHNFRLLCAQATLLRDGQICEDCVGTLPWRGVLRGCYRGSVGQSGVLVTSLALHRAMGTYRHKIARYIALTEFSRNKFIEGGLPADRIDVKPNFVDAPPLTSGARAGALFVGRLSPEKGIDVLLDAAKRCPEIPIDVVGDGPMADRLGGHPTLRLRGQLPAAEVAALMRQRAYLLFPSIWYEGFPRTLVEAFAAGLPVLASRLGAMAEVVAEGQTGRLFEPGSGAAMAALMQWADANPSAMGAMGAEARAEYERKYTAQVNLGQLLTIYQGARVTQ